MPVSTQKDATLVLTIDGTDYACQVVNASYQMAAPGGATIVPVACGDTVAEPGDPAQGSISGEVYKDTSASGITRALATLALSGDTVQYVYTESDAGGYEMSWSGDCTVPAFAINFAPDKFGRHPLNLSVATSVLAAAA